MTNEKTSSTTSQIAQVAKRICCELDKVMVGKDEVVSQAVLCLLCDGHLLIEDIPGVGKTTLAKALARAVGGVFSRIQFTPDLLPADVTGAAVYNQKDSTFEFRPGPIFGNVILIDEINRATPKTQSALLEAMEERQVTCDGVTRKLPTPFLVIATQNSIDMTGTYPLPEAQLDRFFAKISLGYPSQESEVEILTRQQIMHPIESVHAVTDSETLMEMQKQIREMFVHESIRSYIVNIVRSTREHGLLIMGASPRGSLFLMHAAQAFAAFRGSEYVTPDDVKAVAPMVLAHRVIARGEVRARGTTNEQVIQQILSSVPAPVPLA